MFQRFGHVLAGGVLAALIGLSAAGCGSTASSPLPQPAPSKTAATTAAKSSATDPGPAAGANVPLLAVVSEAQEGPCLVTTAYQHGATVIFRIKFFDPTTGTQLTDKDLSGVDIVLPDGTKLPAKFGKKEDGKVPFWTAKWAIPAAYPTGNVKYTVTAQGTNRQIKQVKFDVNDSQAFLTVLKGSAKKSG